MKLQQNYHTTVNYDTNKMATTNKQTKKKQQNRFPDKLVIPHIKKNSSNFMEIDGSSPCSQQHATGPYPESDEASRQPRMPFI